MPSNTKKRRLFWDILPSYVLIIVISIITLGWFSTLTIRDTSITSLEKDLTARSTIVDKVFSQLYSESYGYIEALNMLSIKTETRITVIQGDGLVKFDSHKNIQLMNNHYYRPEIMDARKSGAGSAIRFSNTINKEMVYSAVRSEVPDFIIRTAVPMTAVESFIAGYTQRVVFAGIFTLLLAIIVAIIISKRITDPLTTLREGAQVLAEGHLQHKLPDYEWYEMSSLSQSMKEMASQLMQRITVANDQKNELEAVFSSMNAGIVAINKKGILSRYNNSFLQMFLLTHDRAKQRKLTHIIRESQLDELLQHIHQTSNPVDADIEITSGDEGRVFHVRGSVLLDVQGNDIGALLVFNDVTKIRELENMRSQFVSNVSHELRTPITSIQGYIETLLNGAINDIAARDKFLGVIQKQAGRLATIIEDLLALSRIEKSTDTLVRTDESIKEITDSAIQLTKIAAEEKNITLVNTIDENVVLSVNANLVEQALVNLVHNSIKYSEDDKVITMSSVLEKNVVSIVVEDHGFGIDKMHLKHLFERFYRVDKARSRNVGGTGLGLSIVKHIVQIHGGTVDVQSEIGQGSKFSMTFPKSL
ncbi:MAG: ATP-binding protein [Fibrobacterales bacterium]